MEVIQTKEALAAIQKKLNSSIHGLNRSSCGEDKDLDLSSIANELHVCFDHSLIVDLRENRGLRHDYRPLLGRGVEELL